jgi:DNA-binding NtrC family response regulator
MRAESKAPVRLLLVDDEQEFIQATSRALTRRGFRVREAQDGETAMMILARQAFDVVVLDVRMPGIDGVDVFRQLRRLLPDLPVILLTGHGSVQQAFETSREGVYAYLSKPCDVDRLASTAAEAARRGREVDEQRRRSAAVVDGGAAVRLLLVDDDEDLLEALAAALSRRRIDVTTACSGQQALQLLQRERFDVMLLDAKMPGLDGVGLLRRLRAAQPDVAILVLTGHPSVNLAVESMQAGAVDVLTKPQSPEVLASRVRAAGHDRRRRRHEQRGAAVRKILLGRPD